MKPSRRSSRPHRSARQRPTSDSGPESRLLQHLQRREYVPASAETIAREWHLPARQRRELFRAVRDLLRSGRVVAVKGDRLCLPREADLVTGRIGFRTGGSAQVFPEAKANEPGKPPIQIAAENTANALHGDTVVVRLITGREREQFRFLKPEE